VYDLVWRIFDLESADFKHFRNTGKCFVDSKISSTFAADLRKRDWKILQIQTALLIRK